MRRTFTTMLLVPALTAMTLGAAACGSDDESSETEVGALTKSEFAEQANDLCAKAATNRESIVSQIDANAPGPEQAEQLAEIIDIDQKQLADVDQLVPPESDQDTVTQLLDQWRKRINLEEQLRTATANDDATEVAALETEIQEVDTDANRIADGLGLDDCTRGEGV